MGIKDLAKDRAQFAYECVSAVWSPYAEIRNEIEKKKIDCKDENISQEHKGLCKHSNEKYKIADNYKSYVKKIPMMVLTNGLGATFAFVYSKKDKDAYRLIYEQTKEWLKAPKDKELVKWIIDQKSPEYRATTNEVLALFGWLKRFADGMIEGEEGGE